MRYRPLVLDAELAEAMGEEIDELEDIHSIERDLTQAITDADGPLQLIVPPEGTRSKTRYWKTGFYYIAATAQVPIILAYTSWVYKVLWGKVRPEDIARNPNAY